MGGSVDGDDEYEEDFDNDNNDLMANNKKQPLGISDKQKQ